MLVDGGLDMVDIKGGQFCCAFLFKSTACAYSEYWQAATIKNSVRRNAHGSYHTISPHKLRYCRWGSDLLKVRGHSPIS